MIPHAMYCKNEEPNMITLYAYNLQQYTVLTLQIQIVYDVQLQLYIIYVN